MAIVGGPPEPIYNPDGTLWKPDKGFYETCDILKKYVKAEQEKERRQGASVDLRNIGLALLLIALFLLLSWLDPEFVRCMFFWQCKQS